MRRRITSSLSKTTPFQKAAISLAKALKSCLLHRMNRRAFLRTGAGAAALVLSSSAWLAHAVDEPSGPDLLSECKARIEKHRKTSFVISAHDASGSPLREAELTVKQLSHQFRFGCNLFQLGRCANPEQEDLYRRQFASVFN